MTNVRTSDGHIIPIHPEFIQECSLLKTVIETFEDEETIPLPNIDDAIMETVIRFFESKSLPEFTQTQDMFPLWRAADYLGYQELIDETSKVMAESIRGKSVKEIHEIFEIKPQ
jgi:hypothetical protein